MQHKLLFLVSSVLASLAGVFFLANPVFAQGATYMYSGTGSDTKGLGGTSITADGTMFKSKTTFTKVSKLSDKIPGEPNVSGYDIYYVADSLNLRNEATDFPSCRTTKAIIALRANGPLSGIIYAASTGDCAKGSTSSPENFTPGGSVARNDTTMTLSNTVTIAPNSEQLAQNVTDGYSAGYYSVLGPSLESVKSAYYRSLASPPCSSQGCNDTAWGKMVGECWASARTTAAQAASLTAQGIAYATANGQPIPAAYDTEKGTKDNFARCLAGKINNAVNAPTIGSLLIDVSTGSVNAGGAATGGAVRDAQVPAATTTAAATCHIDGIGWIICPVINFLGSIADSAYGFLSTNFLETKSAIFDTASPTYKVWIEVRNIANILFVIAFLAIIFSQMTSVGISSYGVKRMLPRLVIAAILVNISYFACQLAVDVSNILGYSITSVFKSVSTASNVGLSSDATSSAAGGGFGGFIGGTFAVGISVAVLYLMLGTLIPVLLASVVALVMILFILVTRQALIVILVIVAPLAFVAYLLPNTEQLYKKWQKMFISMLMLFPIIAVVFGGSTLAGGVISTTFNDSGISGGTTTFGQIIGAAVGILPLFIVPGLLKKSLDSVGGIGAKINGIGAKLGGNPGQKLGKAVGESRIGQFKKYREGESARKRAKIQSGTYEGRGGKFRPGNMISSLNRSVNQSPISGEFGNRATAQGAALEDAEDAELVKNATSRLDYFKQPSGNPLSQEQMMQIAKGDHLTHDGKSTGTVIADKKTFDTHTRQAAIQKAGAIATVEQAHELITASSTMEVAERKTLSSTIARSGVIAKAPYLGGPTLGAIEQGTAIIDGPGGQALAAIRKSKINDEALAGADTFAIETLVKAANTTATGSSERLALKDAYAKLMSNPLLSGRIVTNTTRYNELQKIITL